MAVQAAIGTFLTRVGNGAQAVTPTDAPDLLGFGTPKLVMFFYINGAGGGPGFESFFSSYNFGWDDGANRIGVGCQNMNSHALSLDCEGITSTDYSILAVDPPAVNPDYRRGYITSMDVDGFTLQFDKNTVQDRVCFIALNGSGFDARVFHTQTSGSTGNQTFSPSSPPAWTPTSVMTTYLAGVGTFWGADSAASLGWATSSTQRGVSVVGALGGGTQTNRWRYQRTTKCLAQLSNRVVQNEADFVSFGPGSVTLNFSSAAGHLNVGFVLMTGCDAKAGFFNGVTTTGNHAASSIGIQPSVLFLQSDCQPASSTIDGNARHMLGVFNGRTQRAIWMGDTDAVNPTVGTAYWSDTSMAMCATEPSTKNTELVGLSLDTDGWTFDATTADATARQFLYLALGAIIVTPPVPADDPCGMPGPTHFIAIKTNGGGDPLVYAQRPLRDPATYYGGYKAPRILELGLVQRAASDWWSGAWQAQQATVKLADTDLDIRTQLETIRSFAESGYWHYLIGETSRRAGLDPRLVFYGKIFQDPHTDDLTTSLQVNDLLGSSYNLFADEVLIPRRTIGTTDFPDLPSASKGSYGNPLGVPIILGAPSDELEAAPHGQAKPINIGPLTLNGVTYPAVGVLCGHAIVSVLNGYVDGKLIPNGDYGSGLFAPGKSGWSTIVPSGDLFIDINGRRYTLIPTTAGTYADALTQGTLAFNVQGLDTSARGTASVVTDLILQYKYLMLNFLVGDYQGGGWLNAPTYEFFPGGATLNLIDVDSFDTANASVVSQYGGITGGAIIGAEGRRQSIRQVMQDLHICLPNVLARQDQTGRFGLVALDRTRSSFLSGRRTSHWRRDLLSDPKRSLSKKREWHFNVWPYQYAPDYNGGDYFGESKLTDPASASRYGAISLKTPRQYRWLRDTTSAAIVAQQQLDFASDPPQLYTWAETLCGLRNDVLDGLPITDYQTKWTDQAVWIVQQGLDAHTNRALMAAFNVDRLLS